MSRSAGRAQAGINPAKIAQGRVYAPPIRGYFVREEEPPPAKRMPLMFAGFVVIAAFAGLVWNQYAGATIPRIEAPTGPYKVPPPPGHELAADAMEENALYDALEGRAETSAQASVRPAPEEPLPMQALSEQASAPGAVVRFNPNGAFVAQVAALQSEGAIAPAWQRLVGSAPALFAHAARDVQRADLGARGIYYRVRAGYFFDRENAARFCDRVKALGQDCVVALR